MACRLSQVGHHSKALDVANEAVSRALDSTTNAAGLRRYVTALGTLSDRLASAGDFQHALKEAAKAYELLLDTSERGLVFEEDLAIAQLRMARLLTNLRRYSEALPHAEAAWERLQALAHSNPTQFQPLYYSANDLVIGAQSVLETPSRVGALAGESRAFFEEHALPNPRTYLHRYVCYLVRQSAVIAEEVASDEAMKLAVQAGEEARRLAKIFGNQFAVDEGHIHHHVAVMHRSRSEFAAAIAAARLALTRFESAPEQTDAVIQWKDELQALLAELRLPQ
jgi:tetratricopeptide (TPR) repeat protein